ncbi:MAG: four helix bundle protein [Bacteroidota bacterium]
MEMIVERKKKDSFRLGFRFVRLLIWKGATTSVDDFFDSSRSFLKEGVHHLSDQLKRAFGLIALNIPEESTLLSTPEHLRFSCYSIRSMMEVVTGLHNALRIRYKRHAIFNTRYQECFDLNEHAPSI